MDWTNALNNLINMRKIDNIFHCFKTATAVSKTTELQVRENHEFLNKRFALSGNDATIYLTKPTRYELGNPNESYWYDDRLLLARQVLKFTI